MKQKWSAFSYGNYKSGHYLSPGKYGKVVLFVSYFQGTELQAGTVRYIAIW